MLIIYWKTILIIFLTMIYMPSVWFRLFVLLDFFICIVNGCHFRSRNILDVLFTLRVEIWKWILSNRLLIGALQMTLTTPEVGNFLIHFVHELISMDSWLSHQLILWQLSKMSSMTISIKYQMESHYFFSKRNLWQRWIVDFILNFSHFRDIQTVGRNVNIVIDARPVYCERAVAREITTPPVSPSFIILYCINANNACLYYDSKLAVGSGTICFLRNSKSTIC